MGGIKDLMGMIPGMGKAMKIEVEDRLSMLKQWYHQ